MSDTGPITPKSHGNTLNQSCFGYFFNWFSNVTDWFIFFQVTPDIQKPIRPVYSSTFKMNYLVYLLLALLLACSVGPAGSGSNPGKLQKLFNTMKLHMATCPKMETDHRFYSCPSHLWPGILQDFVQVVRSLGTWTRQRFGADDTFWRCLAEIMWELAWSYGIAWKNLSI